MSRSSSAAAGKQRLRCTAAPARLRASAAGASATVRVRDAAQCEHDLVAMSACAWAAAAINGSAWPIEAIREGRPMTPGAEV